MSCSMNLHMKSINLQNNPKIRYVRKKYFANSCKTVISMYLKFPWKITEFEGQNIHILLRW